MKFFLLLAALCLLVAAVQAHPKPVYSYEAQKAFIPADLGTFYLGMPFRDFTKQFDISKAEADTRFDFVSLNVPFEKGAITGFTVQIAGIPRDQVDEMSFTEEVKKTDEDGYEYVAEYEHIDPSKVGDQGFVYAIYLNFEKDYGLKTYVLKTYGEGGEVRKPDDEFYFYDIQWTKKTSDGLTWLIRSFHEGDRRSLQLLGRITGTEWALD